MSWFNFSWQNFLFSFLALSFEGLPFVLYGSLLSGLIAAFVPSKVITGILPNNRILATLASGLLGILFPVCECGIVPVIRRLLNKGLPLSCAVTFMLASPIVNPIVAFSTFAAFRGQSPTLVMLTRIVIGYIVAVLVGLIAGTRKPEEILRSGVVGTPARKRLAFSLAPFIDNPKAGGLKEKSIGAIRLACEDFLDTSLYFILGAAVAATFNTAVDQQVILPLASSNTLSTAALMLFSAVLTLCSTSDAFIAATFASFPMVARIAFMVFGPMFDLKLFFLYSVLFKKRFVGSLAIGLFFIIGIICSLLLPFLYASYGF
ncbi:MAG: permease [Verrucomicrobia bacterium]|nr:permease [Verrucomicrobiota bacterium]MBV9671712.1 permease [Verrucomicrobiota bacterium]